MTSWQELRDEAAGCTRPAGRILDRAYAGLVADLVTAREAAAEGAR